MTLGILGPEVSWYLAVAAFLFATGALVSSCAAAR